MLCSLYYTKASAKPPGANRLRGGERADWTGAIPAFLRIYDGCRMTFNGAAKKSSVGLNVLLGSYLSNSSVSVLALTTTSFPWALGWCWVRV